jgi:hypothetical protein
MSYIRQESVKFSFPLRGVYQFVRVVSILYICGIIGPTSRLEDYEIDDMLSCIFHKGPDEEGKYVNDSIPVRMGASC